jgi:hypothetical protein
MLASREIVMGKQRTLRVRAALFLWVIAVTCVAPAVAFGYCRAVAESAPAGYDPAVTGQCFGVGLDVLYWKNLCVGYSLQRQASPLRHITLDQATQVADEAFAAWSRVACSSGDAPSVKAVDEGPADCSVVGYEANDANQHVLIFRDDAWPYDDSSNTLAYTTITYDKTDGEIFDADTEINSHDYSLTVDGSPPEGSYDLLTVITHEAGHFLGLAHSVDTSAIMYAHYHTGAGLTEDDEEGICTIYPPSGVRPTSEGSVVGSSCDPTPRNGFSPQCDAPPDAGSGLAEAGPDAGGATHGAGGCSLATELPPAPAVGYVGAVLVMAWAVRRTRRRVALCICAACGPPVALACADLNAQGPPASELHDAAAFDDASDASDGGDALEPWDSAPPADARKGPFALVRVTNWAPSAPAADFCLAPHGTGAFDGPLLAALQDGLVDGGLDTDASLAGVPFPMASAYVPVAPGRYDARFVVAGSTDCSVGVGPDAISLPAVTAFETIALMGELYPGHGAPGLTVQGFVDEGVPPLEGPEGGPPPLSVRFIHAAPGQPPADLYLTQIDDGVQTVTGIFNAVAYGTASTAGEVDPPLSGDANGYVSLGPLLGAELTADGYRNGVQDVLAIGTGVNLSAAESVTVALVGDSLVPEAGTSLIQLVACVDNAAATGASGNCTVLQVVSQ